MTKAEWYLQWILYWLLLNLRVALDIERMTIKYNKNIGEKAIGINLTRLINQTYKLLPMREENLDWEKKLDTIIEEFAGMD